jgi:hypothetical protein
MNLCERCEAQHNHSEIHAMAIITKPELAVNLGPSKPYEDRNKARAKQLLSGLLVENPAE